MRRSRAVGFGIGVALRYREGSDEPFVGAMSSVYHRADDGWRLTVYQQTAVQ